MANRVVVYQGGGVDLNTKVIESAANRINELDEEVARLRGNVIILTVACRALLHHCDPDKPTVDGLNMARAHAKDVLRIVEASGAY